MPDTLSAVDAVSPALDHTRRLLFAPFRFAKWARLAVVTFLSGEMVGGGGGGGTGFQFPAPPPRGGGSEEFHFLQSSPPPPPTLYKAVEASGAILYSNIPPIVRVATGP